MVCLTENMSEDANRKWPMRNRMVTWPMTSHALKGQRHDPNMPRAQYLENSWRCYWATIASLIITVCCWLAILATAWLLVIFMDVFVNIRKVSLEMKFCLNTFRYSYFYFPRNIWSGSHSAVFANLWYSVTKFRIGQYCIKNAFQKFTTSWIVFVGRWTHLKKMRNQSWQKTK